MAEGTLSGLPALTRILTSAPTPDAVTECVVTGPLAEFGARAAILMHAVDDHLELVGSYRVGAIALRSLKAMPITGDLPMSQAYREGEYIVTSTSAAEGEFAGLGAGPSDWEDFRERTQRGSIVSAPITSQGVVIGGLGFSCTEERDWGHQSIGLLDCVSALLGMWMAHPMSGLAPRHVWVAPEPIELTTRQRLVLRQCAEGASTAQIAAALNFSESTIKQELRRAMRLLGTTDRATAIRRARRLDLLDGGPAWG